MLRRLFFCVALLATAGLVGCGSGGINSGELRIPKVEAGTSGTAQGSPQFLNVGAAVPSGVQVIFVGDVVTVRGIHFRRTMKFFFGLNNQLARRPDSLMTEERFRLPPTPFVYTDPVTNERTILEVEAQVDFVNDSEVRVTVPPALACNAAFTNPIVRMYGDDGSSIPVTDLYYVIGPQCVATTPNQGVDIGGFSVAVHGDFFSPVTQVAFRYVDPADGLTKVIGDDPSDDIEEIYITRNTLVIPHWPGVVPNSTFGLAEELPADILLFESIESIVTNPELEPALQNVGATCADLVFDGGGEGGEGEVPLQLMGVRNQVKLGAFTFLPTGVTDFPEIAGITPEQGSEVGGNTVVIHGFQFDAFTADISDPSDPGTGIECPPDSGNYIPPLSVTLVDRETLVLKMPPCSVDIPEKVNFCLRNKFSIDNRGVLPASGPNGDCIIFEDIYTYIPVPPIAPPVVTAVYPIDTEEIHDFGLERFFVVGDWFDGDTTLNGGFEFLLPGGEIVQSQRTILHNRNLLEVFTQKLPDSVYPLTEDLTVGVRVRNVVGHADFDEIFTFAATPDAEGTPSIGELCPDEGPIEGGNDVLIFGENFDTSTQIFFGAVEADVQFVHSGLVIATAPMVSTEGFVNVRAVDDGIDSNVLSYDYTDEFDHACAVLGWLNPNEGSSTGGYTILAYGATFTPLTRMEFGVGDGNFSHDIFYVSDNLLRVEVPEALPAQIGATLDVGATDPLNGCTEVLKTQPFTYFGAEMQPPEIFFVDTSVEVPVTETPYPALSVGGGDRMLVIGRFFDQMTTFDIEKPQESGNASLTLNVTVLTPNIAVMTSPESPDEEPGLASLQGHNSFGDGNEFTVEYVQPGPPSILDVRNLDDGTQTSPIDANDRLLIFGDSFVTPLIVRLTGCDLDDPTQTTLRTVTLTSESGQVTVVEDHVIGVNIPADTFCEGPLDIEVETEFGIASFDDGEGDPIFLLIGPQPPRVDGVFPQKFNSNGGEQAVFFGRNFTETSEFAVRTTLSPEGVYTPVLSTRYVSETVVLVTMPPLAGGMPPAGVPGFVRAEETDTDLVVKILPQDPFTVSGELYRVCNDDSPVLLGVVPDHGFIDGGEQVLLLGTNFLTAIGESNVSDVRFVDPILGDVGNYVEASPAELPIDSSDKGKYVILNDHQILVITNGRAPISPEESGAPVDVVLESENGDSMLMGGYTYENTPAVRTPFLLGITPNETRLNGTTSHLISGGFLTEADRIVFEKTGGGASLTIPVDTGTFSEVNDSFLVFVMPDLTPYGFAAGDTVDVTAEKDVIGVGTLESNTLIAALRVSFAGPPTIIPELSPNTGGVFGGDVVTITGTFFTRNSQVLFGTIPARHIFYASNTQLVAITPALPVSDPTGPGVPGIPGLSSLDEFDPMDSVSVDVAVFTQGGWAVEPDGYTFEAEGPALASCSPDETIEGGTIHIVARGENFVPGQTSASSLLGGTITNLLVHDFGTVSFDYTAPTYLGDVLGPKIDEITVSTNMGASSACEITVHLDPYLTDCDRDSVPTTGVEGGSFVVVTVDGGNFLPGGAFRITERTGNTTALAEIGAGDAFTKGGQFRVADDETIEFTVPNRFSANVPTLVDGNPNVGPVDISFTNANGLGDTAEDCFSYVPSVVDFEDYAYTVPLIANSLAVPDKITVGDINADGVPDIVALARPATGDTFTAPLAFVYIANTFGALDVNGDGQAPDFAGTFTKSAIENDNVWINLNTNGRGAIVRLANLDDDDQLELIIPVTVGGGNAARVLLVDVNSDGTFGSQTLLAPTSIGSSQAVAGIAVGNFDSSDDGTDIAIAIGGSVAERKIVIFASTGTDFVFTDTATDIDAPFDNELVGFMAAGDFDGDGDDDLIWGGTDKNPRWKDFPIVVAEVNAGAGTIASQDAVTNLTGGSVRDIEIVDVDGNGNEDAFILIEDEAGGSLLGGVEPGGLAVLLDPLGLEADAYYETGFQTSAKEPYTGDGRSIAASDINGDGKTDFAVVGRTGEFIVFYGSGSEDLEYAGRSWSLASQAQTFSSRVHGAAAADFNRDGMAEILMGDIGETPTAVILWLNVSR